MTASEALAKGAAPILGRPLTQEERDEFGKYLALLLKWQRAHRFVGSSDPVWIVEHLFLDSLLFLKLLPASVRVLADLGSGAGLPGLPIKIVRPDLDVVLIESRRRRATFLASALRAMELKGARVLEGRVESLMDQIRGRFDAVVMRCAGEVESMIPIAADLVSDHGVVIASGPPKPRPLSAGEWVTVPGLARGTTRRFAVYLKRGSSYFPVQK
ncbi:MAG: 16S rRNA (guanine(527)-N(7))-methyltransferase RsmG [Candidatus Rokuibacteriota bacterium]